MLDSGATELVISSKFARKQEFKLKKKRLIYVKKYRQFLQQEEAYWVYDEDEYLLSMA